MKQKNLLKTILLLCALVAGSSSVWGQTYSMTPDQSSTGSNATTYITSLTEFTHNSISWKMNQWNPKTLQIKTNQSSAASEFRFYNTSAFPGRITNVVITFSALTVSDENKLMFLGGTSEVTATTGGTAGTWNSTAKTLTWTPGVNENFTYFAFYQNGKAASGTNYLASSDAIVVTYETDVCAKPTFSVNTGTYNNDQSVTISCSTSGATIYYTTDGSTPTSNSTEYSGAITVSSTQTIKAIAKKSGKTDSDVAEATYTMVTATPTISVAAGTYNNDQTVTLSCTTTGATIRYTTDGSTPTESSTAYSEAITVSSSQTIKAKAFKTGYTASEDASAAYVMNVAKPTFTVAAGTYNVAKSVELNCTTTRATIRYTTDGSTPTESSTAYEGAISVNRSMTIKAKAFKTGYTASEEASAAYVLKCATPTITKADGDFVTTKEITMESTSEGATIYYTTDETTPTISSTVYDSDNKPVINATTTFKAIAVKDGWTNSDEKSQTFTKQDVLEGLSALVAVTNTSNVTKYVNLTDAQVTWTGGSNGFMEDATTGIYLYDFSPTINKVYNGIFKVTYQRYNNMPEIKAITNVEGEITDGSAKSPTVMIPSELDPNEAFTANLGRQIQINSFTVPTNSKNLTANISLYGTSPFVAVDYGKTYKLIGYPFITTNTKTFRVTAAYEKPAAPTFSPAACDFYEAFELTLSCTMDGAAIHYTTDGTEPTTSSTLYNAEAKPTISATTTVKAIAEKAGMVSDVATADYTFYSVKQPAFGTASGTSVYYNDKVTVTCETANSDIYYTFTTDGSEPANPTSASTACPDGGIAITANTVKIKVIAKNGENYSPVVEATYTLKNPEAPTAGPAAGAVERGTSVTLSSAAGTTIYYTTDGTAPTSSSTEYNEAITIDAAKTIKAIAIDGAGNSSSVLTAAYTIVKVATPTFSAAAGKIAQGSTVTLTCDTEDASIYYTTDGTTPTTSSTLYSTAITVSADMTIKAIAVKANCDDSDVASAAYTVIVPIAGYNIDFEADDLAQYVNWEFTNVGIHSGITDVDAHGGDKWGSNVNSSDNATITASIKTTSKIAHPGTLKFYISKESNNTTSSSWYVEVSENGSSWTQIGNAQDAKSMDKGTWVEVSRDLSSNSNVYVRIRYQGSNAKRAIDDITLTETAVDVTVGAKGFATFVSDKALDFTGKSIKAYTISSTNGSALTLTEKAQVAANEPVLLYSETNSDSQNIPVIASATADSNNKLVRGTGAAITWTESNKVYVLNTTNTPGFYRANASPVATNKAYLDLTGVNASRSFFTLDFDGETQGIANINENENENRYFDLQGRRVATPQKGGLYIVNGKKVVVK